MEPVVRKFYLVDVEAFVEPVCMVPDLGGATNAYLRMLPRSAWLTQYQKWVNSKHEKVEDILNKEEEEEE